MEDKEIIELFFDRSERALSEATAKYGTYIRTAAQNILNNNEDAEECVNDALMRAWNSIPPNRPNFLGAYLGRIVKNLAIDKVQFMSREKRGGGNEILSFEELEDFLSSESSMESEIERQEIIREVNNFLKKLPKKKRMIFIERYWGCCKLSEIGADFGMTVSSVSVYLGRINKQLKEHLNKKGFEL